MRGKLQSKKRREKSKLSLESLINPKSYFETYLAGTDINRSNEIIPEKLFGMMLIFLYLRHLFYDFNIRKLILHRIDPNIKLNFLQYCICMYWYLFRPADIANIFVFYFHFCLYLILLIFFFEYVV